MKVTRQPAGFRPVTLVIENADELMVLKSALYYYGIAGNTTNIPKWELEMARIMHAILTKTE